MRSAMALSQAAMGTTASKARSEGRNDRCCSSGNSAGRREIPWQGSDQSRLLKGKSRTHHRACRAGDKVPGVALAGVLGALQAQGVPSGCGGGTPILCHKALPRDSVPRVPCIPQEHILHSGLKGLPALGGRTASRSWAECGHMQKVLGQSPKMTKA